MRKMMTTLRILFALATFASAENLLILPISGDAGKPEDMATVNQLYRDAVESQFKGTVLPVSNLTEPCSDRDCARKAGQVSRADEVIYSTISRLGSKWVLSSTILKTDGSDAFNQRLTALSIEDMEAVTKRMADALLTRQNAEQVTTLDNLTQKDVNKEPERRRSLYSSGLGVGYIFPTGGSYEGSFNNRNLNSGAYTPIIRLAWLNNWQFNNNLLLNTDLLWGIGAELGADANVDYLFNRGDYSPFLGGGLGLHYVYNDNGGRSSGFALNAQGGVMLFRTYDVNAMIRGYYQVIFNTNVDNGAGFDVDITYRNSEAAKQRSSSGDSGFFSFIGKGCLFGCLGLLAISAISIAIQASQH